MYEETRELVTKIETTKNVKLESVSFIDQQFFSRTDKTIHKDDQNCTLWQCINIM